MSTPSNLTPPAGVSLPLNLALNDGTYMAQSCVQVMKRNSHRLALRNYTSLDNAPLLEVIAEKDGVSTENIYLNSGSGPILKQVISHIIRTRIKSSPKRVMKHLINKSGFPIITPSFTYSKVPKKGSELGFTLRMIPVRPEESFALNVDLIDQALQKGDGLVYIANPNNPTGNVLIRREQLIPLLEKYPESRFWIDEAYAQYVEEDDQQRVSDLVTRYSNLFVSRTFSFAYGLAGVRIGYLLASPDLCEGLNDDFVGYRLGTLQEELAIASLTDKEHLPFLREECRSQRNFITKSLNEVEHLEIFPSCTNFVLCRFTDQRTGHWLKDALSAHGVLIKTLANFGGYTYDSYFRLTLGTADENRFLVDAIKHVINS